MNFRLSAGNKHDAPEGRKLIESFYSEDKHYLLMDRAYEDKKKDLKDKPDNWYWGKSDVYNWEPQWDFDCYKLWSFLCAYYYDFDAENGDIKYWE